jgi:O-antigen/teichoic acid export membrane protein
MILKLHTYLKLFSPIVLDQTLVSGLNFGIALYLVRVLGIEIFGQYSIIMIITMLCLEMQRSIIISPMMVLYHDYEDSFLYLKFLSFSQKIITLALSLCSGFIIYCSYWFSYEWQIREYAFPAILYIASRLQIEYFRKYFLLINKPRLSLLADIFLCILIITGIVIISLYSEITLKIILYLFSISYFTSSLFLIVKSKTELSFNYSKKIITEHWKLGKWLAASSITTYISGDFLILIGSSMLGSTAAGIMKSSQYIMGGMMIIFQSMESILPRIFSYKVKHDTKNNIRQLLSICIFTIFMIALMHGIFIYAFLDTILHWMNSGSYTSNQYTIAIGYILFSFIISINYVMNYFIRAHKMTGIIFITSCITSIVMLITSYRLIQLFNIYGIFIGLFTAQFIIMVIYAYHCHRALR